MQARCYGFPISSVSALVLYFTIVINIIMLNLLHWDERASEELFGDDLEMKKFLILSQTVLCILATFVFFKQYTSTVMTYFKFWVFEAVTVSLFFDLISTVITTRRLIIDQRLDKLWELREPTASAPNTLYCFVITVLISYFVTKLHTAIIIFCFGIVFCSNMADTRMECNTPYEQVALPPPPAYDQCVIECEKPPAYSSLLANC